VKTIIKTVKFTSELEVRVDDEYHKLDSSTIEGIIKQINEKVDTNLGRWNRFDKDSIISDWNRRHKKVTIKEMVDTLIQDELTQYLKGEEVTVRDIFQCLMYKMNGEFDLTSILKGYGMKLIHDILRDYYEGYLINWGGDILGVNCPHIVIGIESTMDIRGVEGDFVLFTSGNTSERRGKHILQTPGSDEIATATTFSKKIIPITADYDATNLVANKNYITHKNIEGRRYNYEGFFID